jgi:hypothetical protein
VQAGRAFGAFLSGSVARCCAIGLAVLEIGATPVNDVALDDVPTSATP